MSEEFPLTDEEIAYVKADNLIQAVKSARGRLNIGLAEAKKFVEERARKIGWKPWSERQAPPATQSPPVMAEAFLCFARNGRWGTCAGCPRDSVGHVYPEFCKDTKRSDHQLDVDSLADQHKRNP